MASVEIFDLIAKISWDTNQKALDKVGDASREQSRLLDELRAKGGRLESQMMKTNDPKKLKQLNDEYQKSRTAAQSIIKVQQDQVKLVEKLRDRQKEYLTQLQKSNDPKAVQGLMRNLQAVENQMKSLGTQAKSLPSKFAGIGQSLLQGMGMGAGMFGISQAASLISNFVGGAIDEAKDAQRTAIELERTLKTIGKGQYFEGLVNEADSLAVSFKGVFDNDDIIKAQSALVSYGKVTRAELSQLLPVIMELASAENIDLAQATDKIIGIMEGRGGATLRQYGLSVKDLKTEHDRLNLVLGEFANKLKGSTEAFAESAEGQKRILETSIKNQQEQIGNKLLPLWGAFLTGINNSLNALGKLPDILDNLFTPESIQRMERYTAQLNALKGGAKAGGAGSVLSGALNPNATELDPEAQAAAKEAEKKRKEEAKRRQMEAKKLAEENAKLQKQIQEGAKKNQIANEKDLSERPDVTNALAQIQANQDLEVRNEKERLSEPLIQAEIEHERKKAQRVAAETEKEKKRLAKEAQSQAALDTFNNTQVLANEVNTIIDLEIRKTDALIAQQERRVEAARESSSESLKIEQARLDELTDKRRKYERTQRTIEAGIIIANQAIAISYAVKGIAKAASEGGAGAALTVLSNVVAIGAGILEATSAIKSVNAADGFKEGGYTGDGDPSDVSTNLGNRGYKYHKKEFVVNEELTTKHRDMLEGMHKGRLMVKKLGDGSYYLTDKTLDVDKAVQNHYDINQSMNMNALVSEMQGIRSLLSQREVRINNNFDAEGFGMNVATQIGHLHLKQSRR